MLEQARPAEPPFLAALDRTARAVVGAAGRVLDLLALATEERLTVSAPAADVTAAMTELMAFGVTDGVLRSDVPVTWHVEVWFCLLRLAVQDGRDAGQVVDLLLSGAARR